MKRCFGNTVGMLLAILLAGMGYAADINTPLDTENSAAVVNTSTNEDVMPSDHAPAQVLDVAPLVKAEMVNQATSDMNSGENMQQPTVPKVNSETALATAEEEHNIGKPFNVSGATEAAIKDLTDRLTVLEKQVQIQMTQLSTRLSLLDKEVVTYKQQSSGGFYRQICQQLAVIEERMGSRIFMVVIFCVIVIAFLLLGYIIMPRRKVTGAASCYGDNLSNKVPMESENTYSNSNDTYDQNNYAAKLNLARAYTEMGDKDKAEKILNDIVTQGNAEERKEAQELLNKINA